MNRFLTLASTGLFATGLAILPVSAFAQSNAPAAATSMGTDAKSGTVSGNVGATVMPLKADAGKADAGKAAAAPVTDAKGAKSSTAVAPAATGTAKMTTAPAPSATQPTAAAKTGG